VIHEGDKAHVWVIGSDNRIGLREVHVGRTSDGFVEILSGVGLSDRVVTHGSIFIETAARHE
jgi:cobalt-zinc-cadmium efflux system membrane fusion protein